MTDKQFKQLNLEKEIFDVNNNLIYERTFRGYEYWYKYNEKREYNQPDDCNPGLYSVSGTAGLPAFFQQYLRAYRGAGGTL